LDKKGINTKGENGKRPSTQQKKRKTVAGWRVAIKILMGDRSGKKKPKKKWGANIQQGVYMGRRTCHNSIGKQDHKKGELKCKSTRQQELTQWCTSLKKPDLMGK